MSRETKAKKVVDVPIICRHCGNTDWRNFRYRGEGQDLDGKAQKLIASCTECGQQYVFKQGEWKMVDSCRSKMMNRIMTSKRCSVQTISDLRTNDRKSMEKQTETLSDVLRLCQHRALAYGRNQTSAFKCNCLPG
jgi:hypothetical protein